MGYNRGELFGYLPCYISHSWLPPKSHCRCTSTMIGSMARSMPRTRFIGYHSISCSFHGILKVWEKGVSHTNTFLLATNERVLRHTLCVTSVFIVANKTVCTVIALRIGWPETLVWLAGRMATHAFLETLFIVHTHRFAVGDTNSAPKGGVCIKHLREALCAVLLSRPITLSAWPVASYLSHLKFISLRRQIPSDESAYSSSRQSRATSRTLVAEAFAVLFQDNFSRYHVIITPILTYLGGFLILE